MLLRALFQCLLNTDRLGAPATSPGSLFQCLTTLMVKKSSLMLSLSLLGPALCFPSVPAMGNQGAEASTSLCPFPPQELQGAASLPPLLQTGQTRCPQPLPHNMPSSPFTSFAALLSKLSSILTTPSDC